ncbi:MAG: PIN domain-containing protein [Deltaproteobacteria bacterium]|nr:PIN domain-containing protein [Deltaproteobacteria bacterium]
MTSRHSISPLLTFLPICCQLLSRKRRVKGRVEADQTLKTLSRLSITILSATDEIVLAAAALKVQFPISYADAFAAAEAKQHNAVLVTGDPGLFQLQGFVKIEKLKRHQH